MTLIIYFRSVLVERQVGFNRASYIRHRAFRHEGRVVLQRLFSEMICCAGFPAGTPTQLCRESAGLPAGNPPDWKNLAENLPDSKELTESQFFQGSRYPRNPENATTLKRNLWF